MGRLGLDGIHLQQDISRYGKVWQKGEFCEFKTIRLIDLLLSANQGTPRGGKRQDFVQGQGSSHTCRKSLPPMLIHGPKGAIKLELQGDFRKVQTICC